MSYPKCPPNAYYLWKRDYMRNIIKYMKNKCIFTLEWDMYAKTYNVKYWRTRRDGTMGINDSGCNIPWTIEKEAAFRWKFAKSRNHYINIAATLHQRWTDKMSKWISDNPDDAKEMAII